MTNSSWIARLYDEQNIIFRQWRIDDRTEREATDEVAADVARTGAAGWLLEKIHVIRPRLVRLDNTAMWRFGDLDLYIQRVWEYYIYDANQSTYCCEVTPSRWMEHTATIAEIEPQTPPDRVDEIKDIVARWSGVDDSHYMHTYQADGLPGVDLDPIEVYPDEDAAEYLSDIVDAYRDRAEEVYQKETQHV